MSVRILVGDCREKMAELEPASVDAIVTDPPYGLAFMGKGWDHGVPGIPFWTEARRVLKPGGHLLAFGGTRTHHRLMVAIEDAGFEIRDCLMWLYGSGFPKSRNLADEWDGWGTALKPAWEPVVMARKPLTGTVAANVERYGTGALNIDGCRIGTDETLSAGSRRIGDGIKYGMCEPTTEYQQNAQGRWPANVLLDEGPDGSAALLDAQSGERPSGKLVGRYKGGGTKGIYGEYGDAEKEYEANTGGASRFFYTAKASRAERNKGLDGMVERSSGVMQDDTYQWTHDGKGNAISLNTKNANHHPTVKPLDLMQWLVRLVTPPGGVVLDPFCGSGSTLVAADREGFDAIGIDLDPEYVEIARRRFVGDAPLFAKVVE